MKKLMKNAREQTSIIRFHTMTQHGTIAKNVFSGKDVKPRVRLSADPLLDTDTRRAVQRRNANYDKLHVQDLALLRRT